MLSGYREAEFYLIKSRGNDMQDYGRQYRQAFLEEDNLERKHVRQAYWLLLLTSSYVVIHVSYYLWRNYVS